jgi:predicted TIM-barrel fold metal-dependent hydrolase
MVRFGEAISADSHVTEPEAAYATIDRRYAHRAPRRAEVPGQGVTMVVGPGGPGERLVPFGCMAMAGRTHVRKPEGWAWDELHPGGFDPVARLDEMERDGVAAEVIYPTVGMVLCNHPDRGYQRACFAAYNRWLAEWCATDPARLVGIGQTAARAPDEAVADVEEILALGLRGVMLPGFPGCADWHHPDWDPLWAALADLGVPASFHILTSGEGTRWRGPGMNGFLGVIHANQDLLGALVLGGVLARHPGAAGGLRGGRRRVGAALRLPHGLALRAPSALGGEVGPVACRPGPRGGARRPALPAVHLPFRAGVCDVPGRRDRVAHRWPDEP